MRKNSSHKITKFNAPLIAMGSSFLLALLKFIIGLISGSLAIMTSAADSLLDIFSSGMNLVFIKKADVSPDKEHPFGHGKLEAYAAILQSIMIFLVGAFLLKSALNRIQAEHTVEIGALAVGIMVAAIVVSVMLTIMLEVVGKRENSTALKADALHYKTDLLTNGGILISLLAIKITGFQMIDGIVAAVMAVYIMYSAVKLHIATTKIILDAKASDASIKEIEQLLEKYSPYMTDYHNLRTRTDGQKVFADIHVTLCKKLTLEQAHAFIDIIENDIENNASIAVDIVIHPETCTNNCDDCCNKGATIDFLNKKNPSHAA